MVGGVYIVVAKHEGRGGSEGGGEGVGGGWG
jgi:hypothetical protein